MSKRVCRFLNLVFTDIAVAKNLRPANRGKRTGEVIYDSFPSEGNRVKGAQLSVVVECPHWVYPRRPSCRQITCHDADGGQHECGARDGQRVERGNPEELGCNDALDSPDRW